MDQRIFRFSALAPCVSGQCYTSPVGVVLVKAASAAEAWHRVKDKLNRGERTALVWLVEDAPTYESCGSDYRILNASGYYWAGDPFHTFTQPEPKLDFELEPKAADE